MVSESKYITLHHADCNTTEHLSLHLTYTIMTAIHTVRWLCRKSLNISPPSCITFRLSSSISYTTYYLHHHTAQPSALVCSLRVLIVVLHLRSVCLLSKGLVIRCITCIGQYCKSRGKHSLCIVVLICVLPPCGLRRWVTKQIYKFPRSSENAILTLLFTVEWRNKYPSATISSRKFLKLHLTRR